MRNPKLCQVLSLALVLCTILVATGPRVVAQGCTSCLSHNWNLTTAYVTSNSTTSVAFQAVSGNKPLTLCGVEFYTQCSPYPPPPVYVKVSIYDTNGPWATPTRLYGSAIMRVYGSRAIYRASFITPIVIPPQTSFYIAYEHANATSILWPIAKSGISSLNYREFKNATWVKGTKPVPWSYHLLCAQTHPSSTITWGAGCGNPTPLKLDYMGSPIYGTSFKTVVVNAPVNGSGILAIGISKQSWGSLNLPLSLNAIAPGCHLLVSMDAMFPVQANSKGECSTSLLLPMHPSLLGQSFYNQAFFLAPTVNALGVIMSNGGTGTVGNY